MSCCKNLMFFVDEKFVKKIIKCVLSEVLKYWSDLVLEKLIYIDVCWCMFQYDRESLYTYSSFTVGCTSGNTYRQLKDDRKTLNIHLYKCFMDRKIISVPKIRFKKCWKSGFTVVTKVKKKQTKNCILYLLQNVSNKVFKQIYNIRWLFFFIQNVCHHKKNIQCFYNH